jgi:hypothetical protein
MTEYGGSILYSCMKIEQWNMLKLFYEGVREMKENDRWILLKYTISTYINVTLYHPSTTIICRYKKTCRKHNNNLRYLMCSMVTAVNGIYSWKFLRVDPKDNTQK